MKKQQIDAIILKHKAYKYACDVTQEKIVAGKYIKIQCQKFLDDLENPDCKFYLDVKEVQLVTNLTKLINMATGLKVGIPAYEALADFQWFFLINALCWRYKDKPEKRRYEKSVLLIARKSGKSFLVGLIFILLLIMEPEFSEFYSVAPDRELSSIVLKEVNQAIEASPLIQKHFKLVGGQVRCLLKKSKFMPLACSNNRLDGRKANVWVADEVGALRNRYPIDAMESSQMSMVNRTGIIISTAYESLNNPMTQEVDYCKKVLDGIIEDEALFCLLYEPDNPKDWASDISLLEANPLAQVLEDNWDYLVKQRNMAIEMPEKRKNFLTKHMNIFVDGDETEVYIPIKDVQACRIDSYDWKGKEVYLGVDLAQTTDNCAVAMVTYDDKLKKYVAAAWGFVPTDRVEQKSRVEKVDYSVYIRNKNCFKCGDNVVSHKFIEDFVINIEKEYGVKIRGLAYDRYNCIASANRWYDNMIDVVEMKQHSSVLHPATKLLKESVLKREFAYTPNRLLELNFANARESKDTNLNGYVNKKNSNGKIDLVVALINAMALWNREIEEGRLVYEAQDRGFYIL